MFSIYLIVIIDHQIGDHEALLNWCYAIRRLRDRGLIPRVWQLLESSIQLCSLLEIMYSLYLFFQHLEVSMEEAIQLLRKQNVLDSIRLLVVVQDNKDNNNNK